MKKIIIIWTIISILLVTLLTIIGFKILEKKEVYLNFEKMLKSATKDYMTQNNEYLPTKEIIIKLDTLIENSLIEPIFVDNENCEGYVKVEKKYLSYEYFPYLKCKNYITNGYDEKV